MPVIIFVTCLWIPSITVTSFFWGSLTKTECSILGKGISLYTMELQYFQSNSLCLNVLFALWPPLHEKQRFSLCFMFFSWVVIVENSTMGMNSLNYFFLCALPWICQYWIICLALLVRAKSRIASPFLFPNQETTV